MNVRSLRRFSAFAALTAFLVSIPAISYSADIYSMGGLVTGTPFDGKLASAGFFNRGLWAVNAPTQSSPESLFWTARSFRYVPDSGGDQWQSPEQTDRIRSGDCEDKALWLYAQLKQNGYDALLVVGRHRETDRKFHVWVVYTDHSSGSYIFDPSAQKRPWKVNEFSADFYRPIYAFDTDHRYHYDD